MIKTTIHVHTSFFQDSYTLETLSSIIKNVFKEKYGITIPTQINQPRAAMIIHNTTGKKILLDEDLADFLGYDKELSPSSFIKRLNSPTTYFIHCDLIDKRQNLLNGKRSTVLARFDIRGQPFERVRFQTTQQYVFRNTSTGDYDVNSLRISVCDENGSLFDFNDQPLEFELEIN